MTESIDHKRKRLKMRSMRRGIKEMDLILRRYSDLYLATMSEAALDHYDALLSENDQDLYQWCSGQVAPKAEFADVIDHIKQMIETENGVA